MSAILADGYFVACSSSANVAYCSSRLASVGTRSAVGDTHRRLDSTLGLQVSGHAGAVRDPPRADTRVASAACGAAGAGDGGLVQSISTR